MPGAIGTRFDFGMPRILCGFDVFFFADPPAGGCRAPDSLEIRSFQPQRAGWSSIAPSKSFPARPLPGENRVRFQPVRSRRFRLEFRNAADRFYTGIYGLKPIYEDDPPPEGRQSPLEITCDKFITSSDCLVSLVRAHNPTGTTRTIYVDPVVASGQVAGSWHWESDSGLIERADGAVKGHEPRAVAVEGRNELHGFPVESSFRYAVVDDPPIELKVAGGGPASDIAGGLFARRWLDHSLPETYKSFGHPIPPGKTKLFKAVLELRKAGEPSRIDSVLKVPTDRRFVVRPEDQDARDPLQTQIERYQSWFDANIAHFDCSDPWIAKLYYHRAYVLRKNMLDPRLGRMKWPTQSEGRWRSNWYPNVISYGAAHQVREARWLRDTSYWQGHVRTWAQNEKPDGIYPSHVTPRGPAGGQYTDWITSAAWEGHLVHPDPAFLAQVADRLAANVRGWQKTYDPDGDGLLLVDSHWWTGMEYQPSFFYFSNYKVSADFSQPAQPVSIDRVDLSAYNYGNALAVGRIYRRLGKPAEAREFDDLAAKIARAVLQKMWQPQKRFFYSLRASDGAVADVKEVIGVYPFYFGMVPAGKGYESAWESILDPKQFWTKWPVASAARECPAYSQTNWPGDGLRRRLHVERADMAARQRDRLDGHGAGPARGPRPPCGRLEAQTRAPLAALPFLHPSPVSRPGPALSLDGRILQRRHRPVENRRTRLQPFDLARYFDSGADRAGAARRRDHRGRSALAGDRAWLLHPRRPALSRPRRHHHLGLRRDQTAPIISGTAAGGSTFTWTARGPPARRGSRGCTSIWRRFGSPACRSRRLADERPTRNSPPRPGNREYHRPAFGE